MDWSGCVDVERRAGVVSGAWVVKGTRIPADAVVENASDGFSAEDIVSEIYDALPLEVAKRVIAFARRDVEAHTV